MPSLILLFDGLKHAYEAQHENDDSDDDSEDDDKVRNFPFQFNILYLWYNGLITSTCTTTCPPHTTPLPHRQSFCSEAQMWMWNAAMIWRPTSKQSFWLHFFGVWAKQQWDPNNKLLEHSNDWQEFDHLNVGSQNPFKYLTFYHTNRKEV